MSIAVTHVLVNLLDVPEPGDFSLICRLQLSDRNDVNRAAEAVGMRQSEFIRVALVRTAQRILEEVGVELQT